VRLYRELEGRGHQVEWSFGVKGKNCLGVECEPTKNATPAALGGDWKWPWRDYGTCREDEAADQA
jgi:hypothetical protein